MMSRLLSWLMRRTLSRPRMLALYTTGLPVRCLHNVLFTKFIQKFVYSSTSYDAISGSFFGQNRQLHYSSTQSHSVNKSEDQERPTTKQHMVEELLGCYADSSRDTKKLMNPIAVLESIARSTAKSAKQSLVLLNEPTLQTTYITLLKDINESIELSKDINKDILSVLWALGTISKRQKVFINKCDIDIYPNERSMTDEILLPEYGEILVEKIENVILKQGLSGYINKDLVAVLLSFVEAKQGSAELFYEIKNDILSRKPTEFTSKEIAQILHCYAKVKSSVDSCGIFKSMREEILHRGFVTFMNNELPLILVAFAVTEQGKSDFYKTMKRDILSRDIRAFSSPELCQILWSFSKVKDLLNLSDLLNMFENEFLRRGVKRLDDRGLAVLLWSFVEMDYFSKKLFTLLRNVALKRNVRKLNADDISTFLRCFAKVKTRINSHHFFTMIDKELVHRGFSVFNSSQLATIIWAFAETSHGCNALIILFKKEMFSRNIKGFSAVELSQITWGVAKLKEKIDMKGLFEYLGNEIVNNYDVSKLGVRQLALLAWSFAVTDVLAKQLFAVLQAELSKRGLIDCNNSALCQILYSFAVAKRVVGLGTMTNSIERKILVNQASVFDNRQLALLVWSLAELLDDIHSNKVFEVLEKEVSSRPLHEYMPADICRILWGFSNLKSELNTAVVFSSLRKGLIRRGLGEYSIAQITMATVALTKANEWHEDIYILFCEEIFSRNSRHFDSIHLCALARCFSAMSFDTRDLFSWLGEEVLSRGISAFEPEELLTILNEVLAEQNANTHFFGTIKKQLIDSSEKGYNKSDIDKLYSLLQLGNWRHRRFGDK